MSTALTNQNDSKSELKESENSSINSPIVNQIPCDVIASLIAEKRSYATKKSYEKSLSYFFDFAYGKEPTEEIVSQFLQLGKFEAIRIVLRYKCELIAKGLTEATVNCRISALRSLVVFAQRLGKCKWTLDEVRSEPIKGYRDTTGVKPASIKDILAQCDRQTVRGKRDYAILRLLWCNALRRNEISGLNVGDFDFKAKTLKILGKGQGTQKAIVTLDPATAVSIQEWLSHCDIREPNKPYRDRALFVAMDNCHLGHRLTGSSIYHMVCALSRSVGIRKPMSPHRMRHSAITAALDATDGDVRKVQRLSRHKHIDTLMIYDDNRTNMQGQVSDLLGNILDG
jgi:integrase/recombinase XerC